MTTRRRAAAKVAPLAAGARTTPDVRTTHLTLGVLPIEVALYSAVSESKSSRSMFVLEEDGYHPVGVRKYDKVTNENIGDESLIVKGITTEDGVIELSDEDLKLGTERICEIFGFVNLKTLGDDVHRLICPTNYYQIRPGRVKVGRDSRPNRAAEKALLAVFDSMSRNTLHALVRITITDGQPAKMGLLDDHGQLRILAYQDQIREELPLGDVTEAGVTEQERKTIDMLVKSMTVGYMPANKDETIPHLDALLKEKQASGQIVALPDQMSSLDLPKLDLLEALEQTLQQRKGAAK